MTTTLPINAARPAQLDRAHTDRTQMDRTQIDRAPIDRAPTDIRPRVRRGISCVQLNNGLWRITRDTGHVLGYVDRLPAARGSAEQHGTREPGAVEADGVDQARYQAKRLSSTGRSFLSAGEFWSFDDAVDCLRFS